MRLERAAQWATIGSFFIGLGALAIAGLGTFISIRLLPAAVRQAPTPGLEPHSPNSWLMGLVTSQGGLIGILAFAVFLSIVGVLNLRLAVDRVHANRTSKNPGDSPDLVIFAADYQSIDGKGRVFNVTECLRQMVRGSNLVLDIANHNFQVGERNFVPVDPKPGTPKRLRLTYSYRDGQHTVIERPEGSRLVLPEDTYLKDQAVASSGLFCPLQVRAFQLAKDILSFLQNFDPPPQYNNDDPEVVRTKTLAERVAWRRRIENAYERRFGEQEKSLLLEFGEKGITRPSGAFPIGVQGIEKTIPLNAAAFIAMAHEIDGMKLFARKE